MVENAYPQHVPLFIGGEWRAGLSGETLDIVDPATEETVATVSVARPADLEVALAAAAEGFGVWSRTSALDRSAILHRAATLLGERSEVIAALITREQGKPLQEARLELVRTIEIVRWFAEEAPRSYGRMIPARQPDMLQIAEKRPLGPAALFTPWNFPVGQLVRKLGAALAAGCSVVAKAPEETPASCAATVRAFDDAGVPSGVLNLVFGIPQEISEHLIASSVIRKLSFTGSTQVGKRLAALAGAHMKPVTMELGGHAPVIVFDDVDVSAAAALSAGAKWRNAGQVCVSPTRFLVQRRHYERFVDELCAAAESVRVGNGFDPGSQMGPLAHDRRLQAMEAFVADAAESGGSVRTGGRRLGNKGYFYAPTVLTDLPLHTRIMNEEPFGPIALVQPFDEPDEAIAEGNRLPYGLAAYVLTNSPDRARLARERLECGMLAANHFVLGLPENPLGGIKDSGFGQEAGAEAIQAYQHTRLYAAAGL